VITATDDADAIFGQAGWGPRADIKSEGVSCEHLMQRASWVDDTLPAHPIVLGDLRANAISEQHCSHGCASGVLSFAGRLPD
jgi:hypothetical protein